MPQKNFKAQWIGVLAPPMRPAGERKRMDYDILIRGGLVLDIRAGKAEVTTTKTTRLDQP